MTETQVTPLLARDIDVFPARVAVRISQVVQQELGKVRVRFTKDNMLNVWAESSAFPHTPQLVISTLVLAVLGNSIGDNSVVRRKQKLIVETSDNSVIEIVPQAGCGCGSRLKSMSFNQFAQTPEPVRPYIDNNGPVLDDIQRILSNNWPS